MGGVGVLVGGYPLVVNFPVHFSSFWTNLTGPPSPPPVNFANKVLPSGVVKFLKSFRNK